MKTLKTQSLIYKVIYSSDAQWCRMADVGFISGLNNVINVMMVLLPCYLPIVPFHPKFA
jgi:hypothetical protein